MKIEKFGKSTSPRKLQNNTQTVGVPDNEYTQLCPLKDGEHSKFRQCDLSAQIPNVSDLSLNDLETVPK